MRRLLPVVILAFALGVLHAGFVSALPAPASALHLPLMLVVGLVATFRFADAFAAAAASGIALDALSSLPFGTNVIVMLAATALAILTFTRVFTNHSWTGLIGMNAGAYLGLHAALGGVRLARAVLAGWPAREAVFRMSAWQFLGALALQLALVVAFALASRRLKGTFSAFFFTR